MKSRDPEDFSPEEIRSTALGSAIVLRDCSLRREISFPTRHACRVLMRAQALKWRGPLPGVDGAAAPR